MRRKGIFVLVLALIGVIGYNYLYQDHRDISAEKPSFDGSAQEFTQLFFVDPETAEKDYLDKTIAIYGTITELNDLDLTLDEAAFCLFNEDFTENLSIDVEVSIKGRFIGFDALLEQVKLSECSLLKNN